MSFTSLGLPAELLRGVADIGFGHPTAVQDLTIPPALEGRDLLVETTARGKTTAYLLPVLERVLQGENGSTRALVLAADTQTGEKVDQLRARLASHTRTTGAVVFDGFEKAPQERALRAGAGVVVATPGRLLEHMDESYGHLYDLEMLVLDEAQDIEERGLLPDVERILERLPAELQILLFTSRQTPGVETLASSVLRDPVEIRLDEVEEGEPEAVEEAPDFVAAAESVAPERDTAVVELVEGMGPTGEAQSPVSVEPAEAVVLYPVPDDHKPALLAALVEQGVCGPALALTRTRHRANRAAALLRKAGIPADRVHGNRSHAQRQQALDQFRNGKLEVLAATDLALQGLETDRFTHLVYMDLPASAEEYVQRQAEAQQFGCAILLLASPQEQRELRALEEAHGPLEERTLEGFAYDAEPTEPFEVPQDQRRSRRGRGGRKASGGGGAAQETAPGSKRSHRRRGRGRSAAQEAQRGGQSPRGGKSSRGSQAPRGNQAPRGHKRRGGETDGNVRKGKGKGRGKGGVPPQHRPDYDPDSYGNRVSDPDPYTGHMGELIPSSLRQRRDDLRDETGRPVDQQGRPTHKPSYGRFGRRD